MPDINKHEIEIIDLKNQNIQDFEKDKLQAKQIEKLQNELINLKSRQQLTIKKFENDYKKLRRVIIDENVSITLDNKIENNKKEINKKVNSETFNSKISEIDLKIEKNKTEINNKVNKIDEQLDNIAKVSNGDTINSLLEISKRVILPKGVYNIDITMPKGTTLIGDGEDTWIQGNLIVDSNCTVENLKVGIVGKSCTLSNNTTNANFNNVTFTGGVNSSQGSFWINEKKVSDIKFTNCKFVNGEYNGVTLVDKGTEAAHIDSIIFDKCYFKDNKRMNIECLVRKGNNDITGGYKNITLINSTFIKNVDGDDTNINISFDSNSLSSDSTVKEGGYSKIDNCYIEGGSYSLEIAGATNMLIVNNKIYPYSNTTNIISISGLKSIKNKLIFNNNKIYGFKDINFEGYFNNIISNYIECTSLTFRENHYSNISSNTIISNKNGVPILLEKSSNNIISDNTIKCSNATYVFGLYYPENMYNNIFNNKIDTNTTTIYQYNLESPELDNVWNNYNNKGLLIADLIRIKNRTSFSTKSELFKLKITEKTTQPEIFVKCKWFGRYNNNAIGGEVLLNFGKYNEKGAIPVIATTGTTVSVTVTNEGNDYTYVISTTSNSTSHCMIEILASATNIDLIDTV